MREQCQRHGAIFRGTLEHRPLVHMAGRAEVDDRWVGSRMAVYLQAAVSAVSAEAHGAELRAVGMIDGQWCGSKRAARESAL